MKTKSYPLAELFVFPSIKGLTGEFINKHSGHIPVYGGRKTETPIGYIENNLPEVKYFSDCLAWNREGSVGYVFYHKHIFSTNDHQRPLVLRAKYSELVDLEYIRIVLQLYLLSQGFAWSKTASKEKVQKMEISIPVDEHGNIDLIQQKKYIQRYALINNVQNALDGYRNKLNKSNVVLNKNYPMKTIYLSDKNFSLSIGKRVLKKDITDNGVPLYSANPHKLFGYINKANIDSYDLDSLIWSIDGNFDWGFIPKGNPFATTDHCGRLVITDDSIISEYAFYQLRESASAYGFNRTYRASLQNIRLVSIDVPINSDGMFDLLAQRELIQRYRQIDSVKLKLCKLIEPVIKSPIDI